jgi:hypothetical protein
MSRIIFAITILQTPICLSQGSQVLEIMPFPFGMSAKTRESLGNTYLADRRLGYDIS